MKISSRMKNTIHLNIFLFKQLLKEFDPDEKYEIKDIAIIIHNHFLINEFSENDKDTHQFLKMQGFNGLFLLYCHRTNKTYYL